MVHKILSTGSHLGIATVNRWVKNQKSGAIWFTSYELQCISKFVCNASDESFDLFGVLVVADSTEDFVQPISSQDKQALPGPTQHDGVSDQVRAREAKLIISIVRRFREHPCVALNLV